MPKTLPQVPDLIPQLTGVLTEAQSRREEDASIDPRSGECRWVAHERHVMVDATCALLIRYGARASMESVEAAVRSAERLAMGHSDYAAKWVLGCAEYVVREAAVAAA